jgi:cytochrome c5
MILRVFFALGLFLCIPAVFVLDHAFTVGPASWSLNQMTFWGTPVANFVFWIGLAHAGTFFSAILLVLNVQWQKRIAFPAEISTIAALFVAALFPLVHLGIPQRFYYMLPMGVFRHLYVNMESPLVWDFVAIFVYLFLSIFFLILHGFSLRFPLLASYHRPLAWLLFPLVLWVHTIVSLDFAVTLIPAWQGAYFPLYFILGALFSGIALVFILCEIEGKRIRRLEELLIAFSWGLLAFWVWELMTKGVWYPEIIFFGFLVPQLFWVHSLRAVPTVRMVVAISVIFALWWERMKLVMPAAPEWTPVDYGWIAVGLGGFMVLYFGIRLFSLNFFRERGMDFSADSAVVPLAKKRIALCWGTGFCCAALFAVWFILRSPALSWVRLVPVFFPLMALVTGFLMIVDAFSRIHSRVVLFGTLGGLGILLGIFVGLIYQGGDTSFDERPSVIAAEMISQSSRPPEVIWKSRCASCHGEKGQLNKKFVYEYYPLPRILSISRLDSLGMDSLTKVILEGRTFMSAHQGRVSESEAKALVQYMRALALEVP